MSFVGNLLEKTRPAREVIGLNIGHAAVSCVVLVGSEISPKLSYYGIEPIEMSSDEDASIEASQSGLASIRRLLLNVETSPGFCVIALPDQLVIRRQLHFDHSVDEDIDLAVNTAIEEHTVAALDEFYFDYQTPASDSPSEMHLSVLLFACRKKHINSRLELIRQAGLVPVAVETNVHAIHRAYEYLYPDTPRKTSLLMDVEATHLSLLYLGETRKMRSYSKSWVGAIDKSSVLKRVRYCLNTFYIAYPYYEVTNLFFIGTNRLLLEFLVQELTGLYGLKVDILIWGDSLDCASGLDTKALVALSPALFLSFGLALRGLRPMI